MCVTVLLDWRLAVGTHLGVGLDPLIVPLRGERDHTRECVSCVNKSIVRPGTGQHALGVGLRVLPSPLLVLLARGICTREGVQHSETQ